jgi:transmembrane sensor
MNQDYTEIDALIAKVFAHEATPDEVASLRTWETISPQNTQYIKESTWLWAQMEKSAPVLQQPIDTESALLKVRTQIQAVPKATKAKVFSWTFPLGVAASLAILFSVFWWTREDIKPGEVHLAENQPKQIILKDNSSVNLNSEARLELNKGFGTQNRRMKLQGKAYFVVTPDTKKPFVIEASGMEIEVVGTQFLVQQTDQNVIVTVTEGKVLMRTATQLQYLVAGEAYKFDAKTGQIQAIAKPSINPAAYATKRLLFDNEPLASVLRTIEDTYQVQCVMENDAMLNCPLSARFDQQTLAGVISVLQETYGFQVTQTSKEIRFKSGTCDE